MSSNLGESKIQQEARQVLDFMQKRDYGVMDKQLEMGRTQGIIKDLSFGRLALSIPMQHYEVISMIYPNIQSSDAEEKSLAWKEFMGLEISKPYRVNEAQQTI